MSDRPQNQPSYRTDATLRGIAAMTASQAVFVGNDTFTKLASEAIPATEIMALRGVFASLIVLAIAWRLGALRGREAIGNRLVLSRAGLEAVLAYVFLTALPHIALGDITVILQSTPLILVAMGALALGERVGWRRWSAVIAGFLGVLLIVRPTGAAFNVHTLLALAAALLVAFRDVLTRRIAGAIPSILVTLVTTLTVALAGFAGAAFEAWSFPSARIVTYLAASALFVAAGNYLVIAALREADVSAVSPYRYSAVLWAMAMGFLVWGDVPDGLAFAGAGLVIGAGLYTFHREAVLGRARSRKGANCTNSRGSVEGAGR